MSVQTVDEIALKIKVQDDGSWVVENLQEKIKKSTQKIGKHFGTANKSTISWMKNMAKATGIFAGFYGVIRGGVNVVKGLITDTENFDTELTQVATLVDTTQVNIDQMSDSLFEMAGAMGTVGELTQGTYMEISSSVPAKNALNELTEAAKFAAGGQAELRDSVNLGTTVLNTYGEAAGGTGHVFDVLWQVIKDGKTTARELAAYMGQGIPIWKEAGMSFEETGASLAVMTQISGNTSISVTALRGILSEVIKPSQEAAKEAERIGANFSVAAIKSMGFENWLRHLLDAVQKNNGDMATLFGRVEALNGIYQLTRNNLQNFTDEMQKMSNVAGNNQDAYEKYLVSFKGSWNEVKNKLQALFISVILPLMKEFAKWLRENSDSILSFVRNAVSGFKTIIGFIAQFKDVIIVAGKVWLANFAISKVMPLFTRMSGGLAKLVDYYKVLRLEGQSALSSVTGAMKTATGTAAGLGAKLKSIPTSLKISVALVGAELVGRALAGFFDMISDFHDRGMAKIIDETEKTTGVTGKLNQEIIQFVRIGEDHKKVVEEIKKTMEFYGYTTDKSTQYVKRLHDLLSQSKEWGNYKKQLKEVGLNKWNLNQSMEDSIITYNCLAKAVGNFTRTELHEEVKALKKQGFLTDTQIAKLLKLHDRYKENQKVIQEQQKAVDEFASSMGVLTKQGFAEQAKTINSLLGLYGKYTDQITTNEDTLEKWISKIDELWKTALPAEKEALEKVREELILGYGEQNKSIVSIGAYYGEIENALNKLFPFTGAIYENREALYTQALTMSAVATGNIPMLMSAWEKMGLKMSGVSNEVHRLSEATKKWIPDFKNAGEVAQWTGNILESVENALSSLGVKIDDNTKKWFEFGEGLINVATGIATKNPAGIIQGVAQAVGGLISILSGKSGELEAAERILQGLGDAAAGYAEQIEELAKQYREAGMAKGSAERAAGDFLDDIAKNMESTRNNFNLMFQEMMDYGAAVQWAGINLEEASGNYGAAFTEMVRMAEETGQLGGDKFLYLIENAEKLGLSCKEITEFVESRTQSAFEGWQKATKAFGDINIPMFQSMQHELDVIAGIPPEIMAGIEGLTKSVVDYSAAHRLSVEEFDAFDDAATRAIQKLRDENKSNEEIAIAMAPLLQKLVFLQDEYGFSVDGTTQSIIDQANKMGLLEGDFRDANQIMVDGFNKVGDSVNRLIYAMTGDMVLAFGEVADNAAHHIASMTGEFETLQGAILDNVGAISQVGDAARILDRDMQQAITGNTMVVSWKALQDAILAAEKQVFEIPNTIDILDTKFADSSTYIQTVFADFQRQTLAWQQDLIAVEEEMATASRSQMPELEARYNEIMNGMAADTMMFKDYLLEIADKIGLEIPDDLTTLQDIYAAVMNQMSTDTQGYMMSAEGVLMTLNRIIGKQAQVLANQSGFGSSWGVYTEEEKVQKTAEFKAMARQWQDNRALILSDENYMRNFYNKIMGMKDAITGDYLEMYNKFAASMGQWWRNIRKGRTWDEENLKWIDPVSASSGIQFIVPPGYEEEQKGYPMMVHSGELVQVYTQHETHRILNREFNVPGSQKLNDGFAPYFSPGNQTLNQNDFKFNLTSPININLKSETKIDKDQLEEIVLELVDDEYRGFGDRLAERIERRLDK